jgi:hypothetical protein
MATFNGANYQRAYVNVPSDKILAGEQTGVVLMAYDSYTSAANLGVADIIRGVKVPAGAKLKAVHMKLPANGGTVSCGVAGTAAKYIAATAAGASGNTLSVQFPEDLASEIEIILTCTVAATATGKYELFAEYVIV